MKVLVLASQKGGVGKTTLTAHLAVEAERAGMGPVALIDTDPQMGLTGWWKVRDADSIPMISLLPGGLKPTLAKLRTAGISLVVIDTPPAITASIRDTVRHADLVIVPAKPSPNDLRAVGATVDIVEGERRDMVFVVNQATARARLTAEAAISLSQHGRVAPTTIYHRLDLVTAMIDGRTAAELDPASKGADEIAKLWKYVAAQLERTERLAAAS